MNKEVTVGDLLEKFKKCKDIDFTSVQGYDTCVKTGKLFKSHLKTSYSLYTDTINAVDISIKRLELEKSYKINLAKNTKDSEINVVDYATQLRYLRDKEIPQWNNLERLIEVGKDSNLKVYNPRDLSNFPVGSIVTVLFFMFLIYFLQSFFSGRIFKLKLINQLETLEQTDLAEFLKKEIQVEEHTYTLLDRLVFKKKNMEKLDVQERILIKNINKNKDLIEEAYRKYMTPADELSEEEIGQIQEEIRIILKEFYEKIGINLNENDENLPFNDDDEETEECRKLKK